MREHQHGGSIRDLVAFSKCTSEHRNHIEYAEVIACYSGTQPAVGRAAAVDDEIAPVDGSEMREERGAALPVGIAACRDVARIALPRLIHGDHALRFCE